MKIVHLVLGDRFNDGWLYQHNLLALQNIKDGHQATIITGCNSFSTDSTKAEECPPCEYYNSDGIKIIRLPRPFFIPQFLHYYKLRIYPTLNKVLKLEKPDIVFLHGIQTLSLPFLNNFAKKNPNVIFYADNHADEFNVSKKWLARKVLHGIIYAYNYKIFGRFFSKLFYVTPERKNFLEIVYKLNPQKYNMEFLPLGGTEINENLYSKTRQELRNEMNISENQVVFVHSGKLERRKKTLENIEAFIKANQENTLLLLVGSVTNDISKRFFELIEKSDKIKYLGWKTPEELNKIYCASDAILQTGSQTVLFEQGICYGLAAILDRAENNKFLLSSQNGIFAESEDEIISAIKQISTSPNMLNEMKQNSLKFAKDNLYYSTITQRMYPKNLDKK